MSTFFCSDNSRKLGEEIIGTASNCETYILIECSPPWHTQALNSRLIPDNLRQLIADTKSTRISVTFLLIANDISHKKYETTLIIYQKKSGISNGFRQQEFKLDNIEQVATTVRKLLWSKLSDVEPEIPRKRDILICTHGSHDQCCARYGNRLYFYLKDKLIPNLGLENIRLWRSSHFGGHRFAPTMIDLPEGRYYGNISAELCPSILTRKGDIKVLRQIYRGWGILAPPIQVLESELIVQHGWKWFDNKVATKIIEQNTDNSKLQVEFVVQEPYGYVYNYHASIVRSEYKSIKLKSSCNAKQELVCPKYMLENIYLKSQLVINHTA